MAKKNGAKRGMGNPHKAKPASNSTAPQSIVFEGKTYTKSEWAKALKVGVKIRGGGLISTGSPVVPKWDIHLRDPFGNDVWFDFPAALRAFAGSDAGPGWVPVP